MGVGANLSKRFQPTQTVLVSSAWMRPYRDAQDRLLWKDKGLSCTYLAHHELESVFIIEEIDIWLWTCRCTEHAKEVIGEPPSDGASSCRKMQSTKPSSALQTMSQACGPLTSLGADQAPLHSCSSWYSGFRLSGSSFSTPHLFLSSMKGMRKQQKRQG